MQIFNHSWAKLWSLQVLSWVMSHRSAGAAFCTRCISSKVFWFSFGFDNCGRESSGLYCVADRLPGSIRTTWSLTENRPTVISLLQYSNQLRLDISGQHVFHFDKWHADFLAFLDVFIDAVGLCCFCSVESPTVRMIMNTKQREIVLKLKRTVSFVYGRTACCFKLSTIYL